MSSGPLSGPDPSAASGMNGAAVPGYGGYPQSQSQSTFPHMLSSPVSSSGTVTLATTAQNNDDAFLRKVLYGSENHLDAHNWESSKVRLLIIQSNGSYYERDNYCTLFDSNTVHLSDGEHPVNRIIPNAFGNPIYQDFDTNEAYKIIQLDPGAVMISLHFKHRRNYVIIIVIPLPMDDLANFVLSNWKDFKKYLQSLKGSFIRNHLGNSGTNDHSIQRGLISKLTSNYIDVVSIFRRFIKTLEQLLKTPRLLVGLTQKFDSTLFNWCMEVSNWIEIKDGGRNQNSGSKFLVSLLTLVNGHKAQLIQPRKELVRIVIMTSNPIVSQKLIFIISGLLSYKLDASVIPEKKLANGKKFAIDIPDLKAPPSRSYDIPTSSPPSLQHIPESLDQRHLSSANSGWEIPKTASKSVARPSVLSHSNSVSNLSSVSYLSSSLSKSHSQSSFSASYLSRSFQYLTNWGNTSPSLESNGSSNSSNSKTPSPALEYDEYPWNGSNNGIGSHGHHTASYFSNNNHHHHLHSSPSHHSLSMSRKNSNFELPRRKSKITDLPTIKRTTSTVFNTNKINEPNMISSKNELYELMNTPLKDISKLTRHTTKKVYVLQVNYNLGPPKDPSTKERSLPKLTGYTQSYIPEFQLQACQTSPDLESQVINSMKLDLSSGEYDKTKTIFISLRAREIKEISLIKNHLTVPIIKSTSLIPDSNGNGAALPVIGAMPVIQQEYRSKIKKFYQEGHPLGIPRPQFDKVNSLLCEICKFADNFQNGTAISEVDNESATDINENGEDQGEYRQVAKIRELMMDL